MDASSFLCCVDAGTAVAQKKLAICPAKSHITESSVFHSGADG
jgi:hypothetical protein